MAVETQEQPPVMKLSDNHLDNPAYTPANLLDVMLERMDLKNDAALSRRVQLPPPVISKLRLKQAQITPAILLRFHWVTGWSISDLYALLGLTPPQFPA